MRYFQIISLVVIVLLLSTISTLNSGCTKPQDSNIPSIDTIIVAPPPAPADTVSLVRKLEVMSSLYPNYAIEPFRTYSFYYDSQKRLTSVGIKTYPTQVSDTFTTKLVYTGNSKKPSYIFQPYVDMFATTPTVDTTWFYYDSIGRLKKDSCFERGLGVPTRRPFYRFYSYPNTTTAKIDWYWTDNAPDPPSLLRIDTIKFVNNEELDFIKTLYPSNQVTLFGSFAIVDFSSFSQIVNPLSKLNISGTPYSLIYAGVKTELLGNSYYPLVYNSNGFAYYLDFISPYIPNIFYISTATFPVQITPWAIRPNYPSEIRVRVSNSYAGDSYIYRYSY